MNTSIVEVIELAKSGDNKAKTRLVQLMRDNGCMRRVAKYLHMNRLVEPDDVKSEFWLGVIIAIPKVKPEIGDPLQFLTFKGVNHVKDKLRREITTRVSAQCNECGHEGNLYRKDGEYKCRKCKSTQITTNQREINMTTICGDKCTESHILEMSIDPHTPASYTIQIDIEAVKPKLTAQEGRVYDLLLSGINAEEFNGNYCKEIGTRLGISPQCVSQYVGKIRHKLKVHLK